MKVSSQLFWNGAWFSIIDFYLYLFKKHGMVLKNLNANEWINSNQITKKKWNRIIEYLWSAKYRYISVSIAEFDATVVQNTTTRQRMKQTHAFVYYNPTDGKPNKMIRNREFLIDIANRSPVIKICRHFFLEFSKIEMQIIRTPVGLLIIHYRF